MCAVLGQFRSRRAVLAHENIGQTCGDCPVSELRVRFRTQSLAIQQNADTSTPSRNRAVTWRGGLPTLVGGDVTLRELREADAASLLKHLTNPSVLKYISAPPSSTDGFKRFIRWTRAERRAGTHLCFGIVPPGQTSAVGVVQIWPLERRFATAEWGFALGEMFWGTGVFVEAAHLLLQFAFETLDVARLEARAVDGNDRGNSVLRKLGAIEEGRLRAGFGRGPSSRDQILWSIPASEWRARRRRCPVVN